MAETGPLARATLRLRALASVPCRLAGDASCPAVAGWLSAMAHDTPKSSPIMTSGAEAIAPNRR